MSDYTKALDQEGWSQHYNLKLLDQVVNNVLSGNVSIWSKELIDLTEKGQKVLEIGCGSGSSSLWLAHHGREVTALDYTESSVALVQAAENKLLASRGGA